MPVGVEVLAGGVGALVFVDSVVAVDPPIV